MSTFHGAYVHKKLEKWTELTVNCNINFQFVLFDCPINFQFVLFVLFDRPITY